MAHQGLATNLKTLSNTHKRIYETQEHFLKMYARCGTILNAAKATGISRPTVYAWRKQDTLGFAERFQLAKEEYRESLEDLAHSRLLDPKGNIGSDLLLISQLNARWPERYRQGSEEKDSVGRETLDTLKQMQRDWKKKLEAGTVDGGNRPFWLVRCCRRLVCRGRPEGWMMVGEDDVGVRGSRAVWSSGCP